MFSSGSRMLNDGRMPARSRCNSLSTARMKPGRVVVRLTLGLDQAPVGAVNKWILSEFLLLTAFGSTHHFSCRTRPASSPFFTLPKYFSLVHHVLVRSPKFFLQTRY
jgi:hypothetical protein